MKHPLAQVGVAVACSLCGAAPGLAWGPQGHELVAEIARLYLTPAARAGVEGVLGSYKLSDFEVTCWPDIIRGNKEYDGQYPHNGSWHYINFDVTQWYDENFILETSQDGNDIVTQILHWRDELADSKLEKKTRLDALRFLVHFVGDLHQPLHCAYRYGDMGGNMLPVNSFHGQHYSFEPDTPMDYPPSLHSTWDEYLVNELVAGQKTRTFARALRKEITPDQVGEWSDDDALGWAQDSYWVARKQVYRWTNGERVPFKWAEPGMDLTSENYIDSHLTVVREQLKKAGVRLAHLINTALDPKYVPPVPAPAPVAAAAETNTPATPSTSK